MPKLGEYFLNWDEDSDNQLLNIEREYRKPCKMHKNGSVKITYLVDWKRAEWEGAFKGLPKMDRSGYSKRLSHLRQIMRDPDGYLKKRKKINRASLEKYKEKHGHYRKRGNKRRKIFNSLPEEFKIAHGWQPKQFWTNDQRKILFEIVNDYHNGLESINWIALMQDKRILKLPEKYHQNLHALRKYYWSWKCLLNGGEEALERKRALARKYKKENSKKFYEDKSYRDNIVRDIVNVHLNSILPRVR